MHKRNTSQKQTMQNIKTNLLWFSRFSRHSARKRDGLILQCSRAQIIIYVSHCRISPSHILAECREKRPNQSSFVLMFCIKHRVCSHLTGYKLFTDSKFYVLHCSQAIDFMRVHRRKD